jgi:hypothetical protein
MMKDMGIVQGSPEMAVPLVVGKDTVYVHTDIQQVPDEEGNMVWQYHEIQYDKDEYIRLLSEKNDKLDEILNTLLGVNSNG